MLHFRIYIIVFILQTWPDLLLKWKRLGLHREAVAPETPLG
jgi:hypothetical protein